MGSASRSIRSRRQTIRRRQVVDAADVVFDATIPYDLRFFKSLDEMVQAEPWLERDKAMIDQLKTIGIDRANPSSRIEKGSRFGGRDKGGEGLVRNPIRHAAPVL